MIQHVLGSPLLAQILLANEDPGFANFGNNILDNITYAEGARTIWLVFLENPDLAHEGVTW
jgi:hypothetical protein